jgi:hypothetical protein
MNKLRLDLDRLEVESFATDRGEGERGTVEAHVSLRCTGGGLTCDAGNTCADGDTCGAQASCYISCNGSCPAPCTNEFSYCYNNTCFNCSYPDYCGPG